MQSKHITQFFTQSSDLFSFESFISSFNKSDILNRFPKLTYGYSVRTPSVVIYQLEDISLC